MRKLFYIHKDLNGTDKNQIWFRWKIGKLMMARIGQETKKGVVYPFEVFWDGVKIIKVGWYV